VLVLVLVLVEKPREGSIVAVGVMTERRRRFEAYDEGCDGEADGKNVRSRHVDCAMAMCFFFWDFKLGCLLKVLKWF
jgi:hypothetical protein